MRNIIRRIVQAFFVVYVVISFSFALVRLMPGSPVDYLRAKLAKQYKGQANTEAINEIIVQQMNINPSDPLHEQYFHYVIRTFQGDLGESFIYGRPVADVIIEAAPWTIFVVGTALILTFVINIALGAFMAYKEGSRFDVSMTMLSTLITSTPFYIAAIFFIFLFAYQIPIFPSGGRYASGLEPGLTTAFILSVVYHSALPIASSVVIGLGSGALGMRGNSIQVLGKDYLRVAQLRGLSHRRITFRYVARNAILPMYTNFMIAIGSIFGGSVILEMIFNYPGLGYYIVTSVSARDYQLMMGGFLLITIAVVIALFIADLTYSTIDPRAGSENTNAN